MRSWAIEDHAERPVHDVPSGLADEIQQYRPTASFFIASSQAGEISFRMPLMDLLIHQLRCRHGHMVGIDHRLMLEGMAADYDEIYRVTRQVFEAVKPAARIEVQTRLGTDLVASFSPDVNTNSRPQSRQVRILSSKLNLPASLVLVVARGAGRESRSPLRAASGPS